MEGVKIGIIGMGYVGLPLACLFAERYPVIGYDQDAIRVDEINSGIDQNLQIEKRELLKVLKSVSGISKGLFCSHDTSPLRDCTIYIITVPTPVDASNHPDLKSLYSATETVAGFLKEGDTVIYESTVYPGLTEESCVPKLEDISGLKFNKDFFVGYSPERINPGDKEHSIKNIIKVTSGSTPETAEKVDELYSSVIDAGTYLAPSIKVAEAAKVIENTQRDINIAFVNELAKIFNLLEIDTNEVLKAAGTKWNFLNFKPGLVGGHCIGVDPYYLAQKALELDYHPEIILAGRRINDTMGRYVSSEVVKLLIQRDIPIKESKILILGITFKENCPDFRNTKVIDLVEDLKSYGAEVQIFDPWASKEEIFATYHQKIESSMPKGKFDAIILAVGHHQFEKMGFRKHLVPEGILYDVKGFIKEKTDGRL